MNKEGPGADYYHILLPALEQTMLAVVLIDECDRVLFFNAAAERLWGYARDEVLGQHMRPLLPKTMREVHSRYIRRNRQANLPRPEAMSRDILMEKRDGLQLWAKFFLSKVDVDGRIHFMAIARDVTDEVARREETRLLLLAINNTDRVVCVLDAARRIVQINRAFTSLFGYTAEESIGKGPSELLASPRTDKSLLDKLRTKTQDWLGVHGDILTLTKEGRDVWVRFSVNPIFDERNNEHIKNYVVVLSDVTEERLIQDLERDALEALTSSLSFNELGNFLCRRIEAIVPDVLVSVCRVEDNKLRPWAAPSFHDSYGSDWEGVEIGEGVAGCGTAAFRGEQVMVDDIETNPLWEPYKHQILPHGLRACWTYPIKQRDGRVLGTFAFYFRQGLKPNTFLEHIADASIHLCTLAIEREDNRRQMARVVRFDALTGLPNRSYMHCHVDDLLASSSQKIGFFNLDLDHFKDINDMFGHAAGDQVLVAMANRLQSWIRSDEFISRTETDQFVIVIPNFDVSRASALASQVLSIVREPINISGHRLSLSASLGISQYPEGGATREVLLTNAMNAMYKAKKSGGNVFRFFSAEMNVLASERLLLGAALKSAVAHRQLHLHYQPQVCTRSGQLFGVEALARWHHPEFGDVPPDRFIRLAEDIGEIDGIGRWALEEACRQMAAWRAEGIRVPVVSVNLSSYNFNHPDLPAYVARQLQTYGLAGSNLTIEITESLMMALTDETLDILNRIRALGVGLSVDDFGTGFSSLSSLANLPVTEVKIDRSFIDQCGKQNRLRSVVHAVIGIGRSLDLMVVAEGVETDDQRNVLIALDCPVVQGYLFSKPLPPNGLQQWMASAIPSQQH